MSAFGTFRKCHLRRVKAALGSTADSSKPPEGVFMSSRPSLADADLSTIKRHAARFKTSGCLARNFRFRRPARLADDVLNDSALHRIGGPGPLGRGDEAIQELLRRTPGCCNEFGVLIGRQIHALDFALWHRRHGLKTDHLAEDRVLLLAGHCDWRDDVRPRLPSRMIGSPNKVRRGGSISD